MHKCTNCGGTKLEPYRAYDGYDVNANVNAYVCMDCLHIEFYADENSSEFTNLKAKAEHREYVFQIVKEKSAKIEEIKKTLPPKEARKKEIEDKIKSLQIASQDENITIKQQKEYLAELETLRYELAKAIKAYNDDVDVISEIEQEIQQLYKSLE